jgi:hypothetical protein
MEKLDKETISKEQLGSGYKDYELVKISYISGLEYAENHYLKLIEEKDKRNKELIENVITLQLEIKQAKKLLRQAIKPLKAIERDIINCQVQEFLKK